MAQIQGCSSVGTMHGTGKGCSSVGTMHGTDTGVL
jgi:hypothetical protein